MTTFGAVSPVPASTMASASTVSPASFHNLTNHVNVILSPNREDVSLTLSPSSSFLSSFPSVCSSSAKSSIPSNFATSTFVYSSDTKENSSCPVNSPSMSHNAGQHTDSDLGGENKTEGPSCRAHDMVPVTKLSSPDGDPPLVKEEEAVELDENSSSNSNSTLSSLGSGRKRRRRGEDQLLMEDLSAIDKSLADGITNQLKPASPTQTQPEQDQFNGPSESPSQAGDGELKKSKEDSPAFHLRPRRSHKSSGHCSSGSSSPVFFSPIKRNKQPLVKKLINNYTQQLLSDTSRQLYQLMDDQSNSNSGHNASSAISPSHCQPILIKEEPKVPKQAPKPRYRSYTKSVMRDVDVSVFSELITPFDLAYSNEYPLNYISMQIAEIKPLRYVQISHPTTESKITSPLLELKTIDMNDRFSLSHAKGVFDHTSISQASTKHLTIYLLGTYATKGVEHAVAGQVVNIVKFRTSKLVRNGQPLQPPKKRKLVASSSKMVDMNDDDNAESYPFHVIVDSMGDIASIQDHLLKEEPVKWETSETNGQQSAGTSAPDSCTFEALFHSSPRTKEACDPNWVPFVSFSAKWRAPKDPKELNKTLYILQPCIPKFESASRTVKMN